MNIKAIDEAQRALEEYTNKLQSVFSEVSDPALVKIADTTAAAKKGLQMAVDERNDYVQNLVQCVLDGKEVKVNKYVFQEMHKHVAREIETMLRMAKDMNTNEWTRREIMEHSDRLEDHRRIMFSIGYGTYGLYVADFQDEDIVEGYLQRLKAVMIFVEQIQKRAEEIYENNIAAGSEG